MAEPTDAPVVRVDGLTVERGGTTIIEAMSLAIPKGPPFAIVGESGSGKTTLLMAILGLLDARAGEIAVAGRRMDELTPRERARLAGMVFQDYQLFPHLTVLRNCTLAPDLRGDEGTETRARELLGDLGIGDLAGRHFHELSGGQRQRAAIARSLMLEPEVLFFDEPSAALDLKTSAELADLLVRLNDRSQVVIVSHDWPFIEGCCERGVLLDAGRVAAEGPLGELRDA